MKKVIRLLLIALGGILVIIVFGWVYTSIQLGIARSKGVYASAEQGMLANAEKYYSADREVKILYAGTNSFDGNKPHVWYVIAEIRATSRANGSDLGHNRCGAPGSFFLQTREGWVHVSEAPSPLSSDFG